LATSSSWRWRSTAGARAGRVDGCDRSSSRDGRGEPVTRVYVARHPTDAHLFKGILEAQGIEALVRGEALFGARGEAPVTFDTLPSVWVMDDDDVDRARALADEYAKGDTAAEPRPTWRCAACREVVEGQFSECWQCGATRP